MSMENQSDSQNQTQSVSVGMESQSLQSQCIKQMQKAAENYSESSLKDAGATAGVTHTDTDLNLHDHTSAVRHRKTCNSYSSDSHHPRNTNSYSDCEETEKQIQKSRLESLSGTKSQTQNHVSNSMAKKADIHLEDVTLTAVAETESSHRTPNVSRSTGSGGRFSDCSHCSSCYTRPSQPHLVGTCEQCGRENSQTECEIEAQTVSVDVVEVENLANAKSHSPFETLSDSRRQKLSGTSKVEGVDEPAITKSNAIPQMHLPASSSSHGDSITSNHIPTITTQLSEQLYPEKPEGFSSYLWSELSRGYEPDENEAAFNVKRERVYAFLRIPKECEKFMFYGFLQCVDSFLFIFTFLPLRLIIIFLKLLIKPWTLCMPHWYLSASQKCDIVKGIIIALGCLAMHQVDASMYYHIIRGQAIIKLYIFFNLLEVGDRLFSSFGQDILDAVMWTVADSKQRHTGVVLGHIAFGTIYVFLHSMLVLLQASALSVAFNSHNKALLTILISNNAVELKGSVFKKFEKTNLFQMACSDVRERFHFQVLIFIVCLRNMTDSNWDIEKLVELIPDIVLLMGCEIVIDGTKHAFITKFNNIPHTVYREYTVLLANDVITSRKKSAFSDVSDQVSRRLGLIPLPLACLLIKIVAQSFKIQTPLALANATLAFLCLFGAKLVIGVIVYGWAVDYYNDYHRDQARLSKRQRHKSGIDEDLLKCENNYHWYKKPVTTTLQPPSSPDMDRKKQT